eukprot:2314024-Heterocapsa_arctica.AAC.1
MQETRLLEGQISGATGAAHSEERSAVFQAAVPSSRRGLSLEGSVWEELAWSSARGSASKSSRKGQASAIRKGDGFTPSQKEEGAPASTCSQDMGMTRGKLTTKGSTPSWARK